MAHSTGCSAVLDYLADKDRDPFGRIVLAAPLIRSTAWHVSGLANAIVGVFADSVPRVFRKNSSDEAFLDFMKQDPLQARRVPKKWVRALRRWSKGSQTWDQSQRHLKVIQGTADTTVAWRYNMKFIAAKFPNAEIELVEKGGHQLINESDGLRSAVLTAISDYLAREESGLAP